MEPIRHSRRLWRSRRPSGQIAEPIWSFTGGRLGAARHLIRFGQPGRQLLATAWRRRIALRIAQPVGQVSFRRWHSRRRHRWRLGRWRICSGQIAQPRWQLL
jgi:hypothetical protein